MRKDELALEQKFEEATGGNLKIIEQVDQEINGKKVPALKVEKTSVKFCNIKILEQLGKHGFHLHNPPQSSPFIYFYDGGA